MIHSNTHAVTVTNGPRPAGKPDECFYCQSHVGTTHAPDCVLRERTIVVRATIEYVVTVPEHWDAHQIVFHRNDGTWCASNGLAELAALAERLDAVNSCPCSYVEYGFVREATIEDLRANCISHLDGVGEIVPLGFAEDGNLAEPMPAAPLAPPPGPG